MYTACCSVSVDSQDNVNIVSHCSDRLVLLSVELKHLAATIEFSTDALSGLADQPVT